jgi:hypothetical protein
MLIESYQLMYLIAEISVTKCIFGCQWGEWVFGVNRGTKCTKSMRSVRLAVSREGDWFKIYESGFKNGE